MTGIQPLLTSQRCRSLGLREGRKAGILKVRAQLEDVQWCGSRVWSHSCKFGSRRGESVQEPLVLSTPLPSRCSSGYSSLHCVAQKFGAASYPWTATWLSPDTWTPPECVDHSLLTSRFRARFHCDRGCHVLLLLIDVYLPRLSAEKCTEVHEVLRWQPR